MKKFIICPQKMGSESATALAKFFNEKKVYPNKRYKSASTKMEINWGRAETIPVFGTDILNPPIAVANSSNKIKTFELLDDANVNIPFFTTDRATAPMLFDQSGVNTVFCRTLTRASEGRGIVIATNAEELVSASLYTAREPHTNEYRVHVFNGEVIDIVEKRRMGDDALREHDIETIDENVRSNDRGWVFARGNARLAHTDGQQKLDIAVQAKSAITALGLDFGAVDVIYNNPSREAFVLEVNSAPGMEDGSTTLFSYVKAFQAKLGGQYITIAEFNSRYPEMTDIVEYERVTNFINAIDNE